MSELTKGAILMAGFMAKALSSFLLENESLVSSAKTVGGVAACRIHRQEEAKNLVTGERVYRWQIEFSSMEDALMFDNAIRSIVDEVTGEGR